MYNVLVQVNLTATRVTSICCSMGCSGVWHMYTSEGVYVIPRAKPEELHNT